MACALDASHRAAALVVHPAEHPLTGSVALPSDKSIGHRALILAALANGTSRIGGYAGGADNERMRAALAAMGVEIERDGATLRVRGCGLFGLRPPAGPIDCGNSGTAIRLLTGVLAAQPFASRLVGDASLSSRPMRRVVEPLRARGAIVTGRPCPARPGEVLAPLEIAALPEGVALAELEVALPIASAQVKSALLLSGLWAHGATRLSEPFVSRDHTERMMLALGVPLRTMGPYVELDPAGWSGQLPPLDVDLPGDPSAAAFLLLASQIVSGSRIDVRDLCTNPTRTGVFEIARDMGADLEIEPRGERNGEPVGVLRAASGHLHSTCVGGEQSLRAQDELPVVCALGARASGVTTVRDAGELRVKESDRVAATCAALRAFGVVCEELPDGMIVEGREGPLSAAIVDSRGDHRIAMMAAVLALAGDGPTTVLGTGNIRTSFPGFVRTLRALGARVDVQP